MHASLPALLRLLWHHIKPVFGLVLPLMKYIGDQIFPVLVGTLAGAWLAFKMERLQKEKEEFKKQMASINFAIFTLIQEFNHMLNIEQEISQWRLDHKSRRSWIEMKPMIIHSNHMEIDVEGLRWILETEDRNFLQKLLTLHDSYVLQLHVFERRNSIKNKANDIMENALKEKVSDDLQYVSDDFLSKKLGRRLVYELQETANQMLDNNQRQLLEHFMPNVKATSPPATITPPHLRAAAQQPASQIS